MNREDIISAIDRINVWKRGDQRAPHKPLLILYALGQWTQNRKRSISFEELDPIVTQLLQEFGPARRSFHPEYPFWRLQRDVFWRLENVDEIGSMTKSGDVRKSILLRNEAKGGFLPEWYDFFENDPGIVIELAYRILDAHFSETMHPDILQAVGLEYRYTLQTTRSRTRDPKFRYQVLTAYEQMCAVCGYDIRLQNTPLGLEAAHIKWHQAGGPDNPDNGLALCSLHHKLLDRGAFSVVNMTLLVSERVTGSNGLDEWLLRYHGSALRPPVSRHYSPRDEYLEWHESEVFRGPARVP